MSGRVENSKSIVISSSRDGRIVVRRGDGMPFQWSEDLKLVLGPDAAEEISKWIKKKEKEEEAGKLISAELLTAAIAAAVRRELITAGVVADPELPEMKITSTPITPVVHKAKEGAKVVELRRNYPSGGLKAVVEALTQAHEESVKCDHGMNCQNRSGAVADLIVTYNKEIERRAAEARNDSEVDGGGK
jgi:hypothetical protein